MNHSGELYLPPVSVVSEPDLAFFGRQCQKDPFAVYMKLVPDEVWDHITEHSERNRQALYHKKHAECKRNFPKPKGRQTALDDKQIEQFIQDRLRYWHTPIITKVSF